MSVVDTEQVRRLESKIDDLTERVERLQRAVDRLEEPRSKRASTARRPIAHDPEVERRFRERVAYNEESGAVARAWERIRQEDRRHDDPDWWLRRMLDRADRDDPIPPS